MLRAIPLIAVLLATAANAAPVSGIDVAGIDTTTRPGNDFEQFANGAWRATAVIAPDRSSAGVGVDVSNLAEKRNAALIGAAVAARPAPARRSAASPISTRPITTPPVSRHAASHR